MAADPSTQQIRDAASFCLVWYFDELCLIFLPGVGPFCGISAAFMLPYLAVRSLLSQQNAAAAPMMRAGGLLGFRFIEEGRVHRLCGSGHGPSVWGGRSFGTFNHNIKPDKSEPPASEKPLYLNRFDQANDPALFQLEKEQLESRGLLREQSKDVDAADIVQPSNHPHQRKGFLKRMRYWHYHQTAEPTFPRTPDLSKGELAAGATVVRTSVWATPDEPAVVSVGRFAPENFRPAGYAENAPNPTSINSDAHPDFRDYRLGSGSPDRRPFMYFLSASYFFIGASMMRSLLCKMVHFWWVSKVRLRLLSFRRVLHRSVFSASKRRSLTLRRIAGSLRLPMRSLKDLMAAGTTEIDLRPIEVGTTAVFKWRGKPVFVRHRTEEEIERAKADDLIIGTMKDPQTDAERCPRPEWLINIGVWRVRQGPAPTNLEIPETVFLDDHTVKLG
ncbi:hypothetical protein Efla_002827 [Eimeria flavescens]